MTESNFLNLYVRPNSAYNNNTMKNNNSDKKLPLKVHLCYLILWNIRI